MKHTCHHCKQQFELEDMIEHDGEFFCPDCLEEYEGICSSCGDMLEPIYENNGFSAPDPTHYEVTGFKVCDCHRSDEDSLDNCE